MRPLTAALACLALFAVSNGAAASVLDNLGVVTSPFGLLVFSTVVVTLLVWDVRSKHLFLVRMARRGALQGAQRRNI